MDLHARAWRQLAALRHPADLTGPQPAGAFQHVTRGAFDVSAFDKGAFDQPWPKVSNAVIERPDPHFIGRFKPPVYARFPLARSR